MEQLQDKLKKLIELMSFTDFSVNYEAESNRFLIFINESDIFKKFLPSFVTNLDHLVRLMANKSGEVKSIFIDINNYRRERENLILELARAAARKVVATKQEVPLPAMNAYERRLIHLELSSHPDVKTESIGEGKSRYIVIKLITNNY